MQVTPNGKMLVSVGGDEVQRLCVWDSSSFRKIAEFSRENITSASVSRRSDEIALVDMAELAILDLKHLKPKRRLAADETATFSEVAFSPANDTLALVESGRIKVLNANTLKAVREFTAEGDRLQSISYSPDGKMLAAVTAEANKAILFTISAAKQEVILQPAADPIVCFAFSPDAKSLVVSTTGGSIYLLDLVRKKQLASRMHLVGTGVAPAPSAPVLFVTSSIIAVGGADGVIRFLDLSLKSMGQIRGHQDFVGTLAQKNGTNLLFSGGADHFVRCWDIETKKEMAVSNRLPGRLGPIAVDANWLAAAAGEQIILWDLRSGKVTRRLDAFKSPVLNLARSPDGRLLAASTRLEMPNRSQVALKVWDAEKGLRVFSYPSDLGRAVTIPSVTFLGDEVVAFCEVEKDARLHAWHLRKKHQLWSINSHPLFGLEPVNQNRILAYGYGPNLYLVDPQRGKPIDEVPAHKDRVLSIDYHAGTGMVLSIGSDRRARLWSATDEKLGEVGELDEGEPLAAGAISVNGTVAALGTRSGNISIWDINLRKRLCRLTGHSASISGLKFVDDDMLVSASLDNTCLVWSLRAQKKK